MRGEFMRLRVRFKVLLKYALHYTAHAQHVYMDYLHIQLLAIAVSPGASRARSTALTSNCRYVISATLRQGTLVKVRSPSTRNALNAPPQAQPLSMAYTLPCIPIPRAAQ